MDAVKELAKMVGVLSWTAGLLLLAFAPTLALFVLLVALLLTLWVRQKDQERRHRELLERL